MSLLLFLALLLPSPVADRPRPPGPAPKPAAAPAPEKFLGCLVFLGKPLAVMDSTEVLLDGKPTPYYDVPDEGTDLAAIAIDLRRNVILKLAYVTRKDF